MLIPFALVVVPLDQDVLLAASFFEQLLRNFQHFLSNAAQFPFWVAKSALFFAFIHFSG